MQRGRYLSPRVKVSLETVEDEDVVDHVFFVQRGVIHTEFVREGETVNSDLCLSAQKWLCEGISELRRQFGEKNIWFVFHNNAPCSFRHDTEAHSGESWHGASHNAPESAAAFFFVLYPENDPPRKQISSTQITSRRMYPHN